MGLVRPRLSPEAEYMLDCLGIPEEERWYDADVVSRPGPPWDSVMRLAAGLPALVAPTRAEELAALCHDYPEEVRAALWPLLEPMLRQLMREVARDGQENDSGAAARAGRAAG